MRNVALSTELFHGIMEETFVKGGSMRRITKLLILVLMLGFAGCSSGSPNDSVNVDGGGIPFEICQAISTDIESRIKEALSGDDAKGITVLDASKEGEVSVTVSLWLNISPTLNASYFADDVKIIVPVIHEVLGEYDTPFSTITIIAQSEDNPADPEGMISWRSNDGDTGIYVNNTYDENIFEANVHYLELPGAEDESSIINLTLELSSGVRSGSYMGELIDGLPDGHGSFTSISDEGIAWTYTGEWIAGHMQGLGETTWDNGSRHVGTYWNDLPNGEGVLYFNDEIVYEGHFANGVFVEDEE